mmetsp:Transcript_1759/g.4015  ORF Transcript_1759/g.4015 Transcript_1759/m.4015 type:complete len:264 (+) Transcript_1759:94-885(+)
MPRTDRVRYTPWIRGNVKSELLVSGLVFSIAGNLVAEAPQQKSALDLCVPVEVFASEKPLFPALKHTLPLLQHLASDVGRRDHPQRTLHLALRRPARHRCEGAEEVVGCAGRPALLEHLPPAPLPQRAEPVLSVVGLVAELEERLLHRYPRARLLEHVVCAESEGRRLVVAADPNSEQRLPLLHMRALVVGPEVVLRCLELLLFHHPEVVPEYRVLHFHKLNVLDPLLGNLFANLHDPFADLLRVDGFVVGVESLLLQIRVVL